jgi:hypothetical protein
MAALFAVIFVIVGTVFHEHTPGSLWFYALAGTFFGLIGAPVWEPKSFRYPTLWQICFSIVPCVFLAYRSGATVEGYALAVAIGVILGLTAPIWVNYVQSPTQ